MSAYCRNCLTTSEKSVIGQLCPHCKKAVVEDMNYFDQVEILPEPMTCGRRLDYYPGGIPVHPTDYQQVDQDRWHKFKTNGNRVCSYCGSLHPDDLFDLVKKCADSSEDDKFNSGVEIECSDKNYKIYIHQPGVRNAMEGGIKFYTQHLPIPVPEERNREFKEAVRKSKIRFERYLKTI